MKQCDVRVDSSEVIGVTGPHRNPRSSHKFNKMVGNILGR